jgi:putative FmdB family regulatory protein
MPIYEYKCKNCGKFEYLQNTTDSLDKCPKCNGEVKKLISSCGVLYKTIGFYSTDKDGRLHLKSPNSNLS